MRTGLLLLVLQSLLLCNAVQAETGPVETQKIGGIASLLQTGGDDKGFPPASEDGDADFQLAPATASTADPFGRLRTSGPCSSPLHTARSGNSIRAPPFA